MKSWMRRCALPVVVLYAVLLASCGDGVVEPSTYGDLCSEDADCDAPLRCLGEEGQTFCTTACATSADCPMLRSEGHCSGEFQPRCDTDQEICARFLCE